jgi:hypothetical protein
LLKECFPYADKRDYDKIEDIGTDSGPKLAALCQALSRWSGQQSGTATALPSPWDIPHRVEIGRLFNHVKRGVEASLILAFEYASAPNSEQENMAASTPPPDTPSRTPSKIISRESAEEKANQPLPPAEETIRKFAQNEGLSETETDQLVRALAVSRTQAEAIGEIAGQQAIADAEHVRDKNFVVRYHGPDDMTRDADGNLREWEFKGNEVNSREVATDSKGRKQGSRGKNKARAEKMLFDKRHKIGNLSNRQGGAYMHGEINELWTEVYELNGNKEHYSVHANTETGSYMVYQRDSEGEIMQTINPNPISIKNFTEKKSIVEKLFTQ